LRRVLQAGGGRPGRGTFVVILVRETIVTVIVILIIFILVAGERDRVRGTGNASLP
jgi:hypothetical protein